MTLSRFAMMAVDRQKLNLLIKGNYKQCAESLDRGVSKCRRDSLSITLSLSLPMMTLFVINTIMSREGPRSVQCKQIINHSAKSQNKLKVYKQRDRSVVLAIIVRHHNINHQLVAFILTSSRVISSEQRTSKHDLSVSNSFKSVIYVINS